VLVRINFDNHAVHSPTEKKDRRIALLPVRGDFDASWAQVYF